MSNQICAIVITYNGIIPTNEQCDYLCAFVDKLGINQGSIELSAIDQKSLTELIGKEIAAQALVINNPKKNSDDEAVENAIIFLGTIFAEELKKGNATRNYSNFALSLSLRLHDEKVKNAVEILATRSGKVSKGLLTKYKMSVAAFEVIRDIYGSCPIFLLCVTENTSRNTLQSLEIVIIKTQFHTNVESVIRLTIRENMLRQNKTLS